MSAIDLSAAEWRKSTYSNAQSNCVEVAANLAGIVAVRDSKDPHGPALIFTPGQWQTFTAGVKSSEFNLT